MNSLRDFNSRLRGTKTYIFSVFITIVAGFGMYTGKLDFNTGLELMTTVGIGSFLRSGINTQAPPSFAPAPPWPTAPQSTASVSPAPAATVSSAASPADAYTPDSSS